MQANGRCTTQFILENETLKSLCDFEIQTDLQMLARRPDQVTVKKKKKKKRERHCRIVDFAVPAGHRIKLKESEKRNKYIDLAREMKKRQTMEHESDDDTNCN